MEKRKLKRPLILSFISISTLFYLLLGYQNEQKLLKPEKHEVEVRLVLVDVIVTKDGEFVTDLTKDDFELHEDGVRVPINSMDLISLEGGEFIPSEKREIETPALPQREKRMIVIFDSVNTIRRELERSKPQIIERLISLFKLGREIMVLELTDKEGMKLIQPFTKDPELLEKAVNKASGSIWIDKSVDELRKAQVIEDEAGLGKEGVTRDYEDKIKEFMDFSYEYYARLRFEKTITGLLALMNTIKEYPGRKAILLISGGIPVVGTARIYDIFNSLGQQKIRRGNKILEALIRFANAHNISLYAVDPGTYIKYLANYPAFAGGSLSFDPYDAIISKRKVAELYWMNMVAEGTGGISLKGARRFENFYQVIKGDLTHYYELSYYPRRKKADGKYHKIKVRVKRSGVKVRFREGYSDYSEDQKGILLFASAAYNPSLFKQIPFRAQAIPLAQGKEKFILWMNLALPVKELILERAEGIPEKTLKLHILVKEPAGENAFTGHINIPIKLTPSFLEFTKKTEYLGYNFHTPELKLKKNKYDVVFALYNEKTDEMGAVEQTLINPDLKSLTQPEIVNVLLGTLSKGIEKGIKPFTIIKKEGALHLTNHKYYPFVVNHFRQGQVIGVFLQIYLPKEEVLIKPQFSFYQEEKEMAKLSGEMVDKYWNERAKIWSGVFYLDISSMLPGDYLLDIKIPVSNLDIELKKEIELEITQ